MPKLDIDEIERRLSLYEARLRTMRWEADQLPNRTGWGKPEDECPRGHKYPEDVKVYKTGRRKRNCKQCEICRYARSQRMHLQESINRMRELRKEYTW